MDAWKWCWTICSKATNEIWIFCFVFGYVPIHKKSLSLANICIIESPKIECIYIPSYRRLAFSSSRRLWQSSAKLKSVLLWLSAFRRLVGSMRERTGANGSLAVWESERRDEEERRWIWEMDGWQLINLLNFIFIICGYYWQRTDFCTQPTCFCLDSASLHSRNEVIDQPTFGRAIKPCHAKMNTPLKAELSEANGTARTFTQFWIWEGIALHDVNYKTCSTSGVLGSR